MRFAVPILIILLVLVQYKLWFDRGNVHELLELRELVSVAKEENQALVQKNEALEAEIDDLKEGYAVIEERAREQFGMIREGETFYQVVEK